MNSISGINRPAAIQFGSDRPPAPIKPEKVGTEDNDTSRQERDTILINPIRGIAGNVLVGRDGQPIKNVLGGDLIVMPLPQTPPPTYDMVTNRVQNPNR
jgi:hypothetical protein